MITHPVECLGKVKQQRAIRYQVAAKTITSIATAFCYLPVLLLAMPMRAYAEDSARLRAPPSALSPAQTVGGEGIAVFEKYGEDFYATLSIGTVLNFGKVQMGLQLPVRIKVIDNEPKTQEWYRAEDWDEINDWTRIVRFLVYGNPTDAFYGRLGELAGESIGHGTIVHRYYNSIDIDHYHSGLSIKVDLNEGGGEFLTNDIFWWNLSATRLFVRPFVVARSIRNPLLDRFVVGLTIAADFDAPWQINIDQQGNIMVDSDNNILYQDATAFVWGLDIGLEVLKTSVVSVTPYIDFNGLGTNGVGLHLGLMNRILFTNSLSGLARLEYRMVGAGYVPAYFNSLYEIEKFSYVKQPSSGTTEAWTKLRYLKETPQELVHGYLGELYLNILGLIGVGGMFEDYQGPKNASVILMADLPKVAGTKLTAYYTRRNFDGLGGVFDLDNAYLVAEARIELSPPLLAYFLYSLQWRVITNADSENYGEYETVASYSAGLGVSFAW